MASLSSPAAGELKAYTKSEKIRQKQWLEKRCYDSTLFCYCFPAGAVPPTKQLPNTNDPLPLFLFPSTEIECIFGNLLLEVPILILSYIAYFNHF